MNGIDGFLGKPSILVDARVASTGAKAGDAAGPHAESGPAAAFGGHLADLSRQHRKASDSVAPASRPNPAVPALVQQSFLLTTGMAEAAGFDTSAPEEGEPDVLPAIAISQASSNMPAGANIAGLPDIGPRGMLAMVPDPEVACAGPGARKDTHPEREGAPGGDAPCVEGENVPDPGGPVIKASRDSHTQSVRADTEDLTASPLLRGLPSPFESTAASQAKVDGSKADWSNGTATSGDAANCGTAGLPMAPGGMGSMMAPLASPPAPHAARRPLPQPVLALRGRPEVPREPAGKEAVLNGGLSFGAITASAAFQAPPLVPVSKGSSPSRAITQENAGPCESLTADPSGGHRFDLASPVPVVGVVLSQQTYLAPPHGLSPSQQLAHPILAPTPAPVAVDARGLNASGEPAPVIEGIASGRTIAQDIVKPHATATADEHGEHGPVSEAPAPVGRLTVNQQNVRPVPNSLSPAQQIAGFVVSEAGLDIMDGGAVTAKASSSLDKVGIANSPQPLSRVKTMQLQLDPEILGKVTVRMRLSGTRLDLRVEAERRETMQLIGKETDLLTSKLQAAGYAIETLILRQPEPHAQHQQFGVHVQSNGQDQTTGHANGGSSAHDRPSTHDGRERSRPVLADDAQEGAGIRYSGGDLYI